MYRSTETRTLLGSDKVEQIVNKEKQQKAAHPKFIPTVKRHPVVPDKDDDDSESGLEFEDDDTQTAKDGVHIQTSFKAFLEQKKVSFTERFG